MKLLTTGEAADRLGLTIQTVLNYIRDGRLKAIRPGGPGGHWRVEEAELDRFLRDAAGASR